MPGIIIGAIILAYTIFVIYKRVKDLKAGKSCCGDSCSSCSGCSSKDKCGVK
jgi:hypothetical protein